MLMKYDLVDLPGETSSPLPDCSNCGDDGVIVMGANLSTTEFCDCEMGEARFEDLADGEAAAQYECEPEWY